MADATFAIGLFLLAVLSGATAAVAGFGIGSLLTPLLAYRYGTAIAVAAVALPHACATAVRWWRLRRSVDRTVVKSFGLLSAAGSLVGALLYSRLGGRALTVVLGGLLMLTAIAGLSGWGSRQRLRGPAIWALGLLSGLFGGLAGNQGGLRSGALLAFDHTPVAFVATATATALLVDAVRTPIYIWRAGSMLLALAGPIVLATIGVLIGTLAGERLLLGMRPNRFRGVVSLIIGLLGLWLLSRAMHMT